MPKPPDFPVIPAITETTEFYTQRRSSAESQQNYRMTFSTLATYLESLFGIKRVRGIHASDAAAGVAGVSVGQLYELSAGNIYGLPEGTIKTRRS